MLLLFCVGAWLEIAGELACDGILPLMFFFSAGGCLARMDGLVEAPLGRDRMAVSLRCWGCGSFSSVMGGIFRAVFSDEDVFRVAVLGRLGGDGAALEVAMPGLCAGC